MLSDRLKELRAKYGISQRGLAEKLFVSQQAVARWETDKATPNPETIIRIAEILNVTTDDLLGYKKKEEAPALVKTEDFEGASLQDDDIKAAFWGGDRDLSQEDLDTMWDDVKNFAAFVAQKKKREKQGK